MKLLMFLELMGRKIFLWSRHIQRKLGKINK